MNNRYIDLEEKLTDLYVSAMLLVFPLFVGFEGYANITYSKFMFFALLTAAWLISAAVLSIMSRELKKPERHQKIAVIFAFWVIVSWLASPNKAESLLGASRYDGLLTQLLYVGIFLGITSFGRWREKYAYFVCASLLGCAAVAIPQMLGASLLFPGDYTYYDSGIRYVSKFLGTIGNTNLLAAYLSMAVPLVTAAAVFGYRGGKILCLAAGLGGMLLSFTESAGGMVALAMAALICAPVLAKRGELSRAMACASCICLGLYLGALFAGNTTVRHIAPAGLVLCAGGAYAFRELIPAEKHFKTVLILIAAVLLSGLAAVYFYSGSEGAVYELSQLLHGNAGDEFGSSRIRIWRETLALVPERLIFGGGPDTLALRLDLEFSRYFPELGQTLYTYADNAHNVYLGYLVNIGLPGLLIYLALIGETLRRVCLCENEHPVLLGCALVSAFAENFFGLGLCLVSPLMWVVWALIFSPEFEKPVSPAESPEDEHIE